MREQQPAISNVLRALAGPAELQSVFGEVFEFESGHLSALSRPKELVERLEAYRAAA